MEEQNKTKLKPKGADIASLVTVFLILVAAFVWYVLLVSGNDTVAEGVLAMLYVIVYFIPVTTIAFIIGLFMSINLVVKKVENPRWFRILSWIFMAIYSIIVLAGMIHIIIHIIIPVLR